jgi:hypothetical protein
MVCRAVDLAFSKWYADSVITAQRIKRYLQNRPFRPFRIHLSDGTHHEVPHPEFAWVFGGSVFVGVRGTSDKEPEEDIQELSILHVTRLQKLPAAPVN